MTEGINLQQLKLPPVERYEDNFDATSTTDKEEFVMEIVPAAATAASRSLSPGCAMPITAAELKNLVATVPALVKVTVIRNRTADAGVTLAASAGVPDMDVVVISDPGPRLRSGVVAMLVVRKR